MVCALANGQCRLEKSGSDLKLSRFNGNLLMINGVIQEIPSGGITLPATGLTAGTTYYIYAYMSGTTMSLETSTTGRASDSVTGVEIKSGDASRTLAGMARPVSGPAWEDSDTKRFVRSWFNRKGLRTAKNFTTSRTTDQSSPVELNDEIRNEFLIWADECVIASAQGGVKNTTVNKQCNSYIGFGNGASPTAESNILSAVEVPVADRHMPFALTIPKAGLSEGYQYASLMGSVEGSSTGSWATLSSVVCKI